MIKETLWDVSPSTYGTDKEGTMGKYVLDPLEDPKELEGWRNVDFVVACPYQPCGCSNCDEEEDEDEGDEGHEDEDLIPSSLWIR